MLRKSGLPMAAVDDILERSPARPSDRPEGSEGITQGHEVGAEAVRR